MNKNADKAASLRNLHTGYMIRLARHEREGNAEAAATVRRYMAETVAKLEAIGETL